MPATEVIENYARNHHHKIRCVKPEEFCPGIFRPPMLLNFFDEAAAEQGLVNHVDHVCGDHKPEGEDQWDVHSGASSCATMLGKFDEGEHEKVGRVSLLHDRRRGGAALRAASVRHARHRAKSDAG